MTNANASVKTEVINNIMLQMSMYLEKSMLDILQRVIEEQLVFVNMDRITVRRNRTSIFWGCTRSRREISLPRPWSSISGQWRPSWP